MSFAQSIQTVFRRYAEFGGTARRPEFWWWMLFTSLVSAALNTLPLWRIDVAGDVSGGGNLAGFWTIGVLLPTLAVGVRRLRDAGYAWQHILWVLLPVVGAIVLIVLCAQPGRVTHPVEENGMTMAASPTSTAS